MTPCRICGKNTPNKKCCSRQCISEYRWLKFKEQVEKDGGFSNPNINPALRKYLAEKNGRKCAICSRKRWMGKPIPLLVDHVDGNPENMLLSNLRLVCGNCNMQLPTFAGRNRGNGRWYRRQRYKEGKSS